MEGKLHLRVVNNGTSRAFSDDPKDYLRATGPDEFDVGETGVTLRFERDAKNLVKSFVVDAGRTKGIVLERVWPGKL